MLPRKSFDHSMVSFDNSWLSWGEVLITILKKIEAIDEGQNKLALQHCAKLLKKNPDWPLVKANIIRVSQYKTHHSHWGNRL